MDTGFRFCRSETPSIVSPKSVKILLSRKFKVDNSKCHAITITEKRLKTSQVFHFFYSKHCILIWNIQIGRLFLSAGSGNHRQSGKTGLFQIIEGFRIKLTKNQWLRFNYWSIPIYYNLLPQKEWSWSIIFPYQSEASGCAIARIARSVGRSDAPKALREPIAACLTETLPPYLIFSMIRKKYIFPDYRGFSVTADEYGHWIWILRVKIHYLE